MGKQIVNHLNGNSCPEVCDGLVVISLEASPEVQKFRK